MRIIALSAATCAVAAVCHFVIDRPTAAFVQNHLFGNWFWKRYASEIPDALFFIVCIVSIAASVVYLRRKMRNQMDGATAFFRLVAFAAPASYAAKALLKLLFGRMGPREWLFQPQEYGFHWFQGGGAFAGFPSGHMVVFTTLAAAVSRYFPRYRKICWLFILALGGALVATNYHFPGDVVAGAYVGLMLEWSLAAAGRRGACTGELRG